MLRASALSDLHTIFLIMSPIAAISSGTQALDSDRHCCTPQPVCAWSPVRNPATSILGQEVSPLSRSDGVVSSRFSRASFGQRADDRARRTVLVPDGNK